MIKALLLVFYPARAWDVIVQSRRRIAYILMIQLLPLLLLTAVFEGYGLIHWGKWQVSITPRLKLFPMGEAVVFEAAQVIISLFVIFSSSAFVRSFGSTFHGRHTYFQAFGTVAYGLSPLFLCRLLDAAPAISPWLSWGVGIILTLAVLYHGVPRMMEPDPAHAFGLFFMTALVLSFMTALMAFFTAFYVRGKFPECGAAFSRVAAWLHL